MTPPTTHRDATDPTLVHRLGGSRAWAVWGAGIAVYVLAVFHRTSLGVAGLVAAERFHISSAQLATFTMVQLFVYAGMQIPVGPSWTGSAPRGCCVTGVDPDDRAPSSASPSRARSRRASWPASSSAWATP